MAALFLRWRAVLVGIVAIAVSLVSAALVLWAFGETMNVMVLAGLVAALVLVVDDAIVDVDAIRGGFSTHARPEATGRRPTSSSRRRTFPLVAPLFTPA